MSIDQTIRRDSASYRQGVVLGLTMAETLLLLVFCLLIAAASIFSHKVMQVKALQAENEQLAASLRDSRNTVELMQSKLPDGAITDDWKRIVRDYGPAIQQMEKAGVPIKDAGHAADVVAAAVKAYQNGATAEEMTQSITLQQSLKQEFSASAQGVPSNEQITSLIREGMQVQTATPHSQGDGKHKWPPIITISDAEGNYFATGSAELSDRFRAALKGKVEELLRNIEAYPDVNVIEVIGYTDERPLGGKFSNLDTQLMPVLQGNDSVVQLKSVDNAGLGLARAVSVTQLLLADQRLARFKNSILPYSGAQLVNVNDTLVLDGTGGDVKERRRIEIRLRQSERVTLPLATPAPEREPVVAPRIKPAAAPPTAQGKIDTAIAQPQPALPEATEPDADIQVAPNAPPHQAAPSQRQFRPFRWMLGN